MSVYAQAVLELALRQRDAAEARLTRARIRLTVFETEATPGPRAAALVADLHTILGAEPGPLSDPTATVRE